MSDREPLPPKPTIVQQIQSAYDRMIGRLSISDMIRVRINMIRNWLRGFRLRITGTPIIVHQHVLNDLPPDVKKDVEQDVGNIEKALSQHPAAEKHFGEIVIRDPEEQKIPKLSKYNIGKNFFGMKNDYNLVADPEEGFNKNPMHQEIIDAENPKKERLINNPDKKKGWFDAFFKKKDEVVPIGEDVNNPVIGDRIDSDKRYDSLLRSLNNSTVNKKSFKSLSRTARKKKILSLAQKKIESLPTLTIYNSLKNKQAVANNDVKEMKKQRNAQLYNYTRNFYRNPESAQISIDKRKKNKTRIARVLKALGDQSNTTRRIYQKRLQRENEFSFKVKNP